MKLNAIKLFKTAVATASFAACALASAQGYPDKPIKFIVPYAPGGSTDLTARLIAKSLTTELGQSVFVENHPGAGGVIAHKLVADAPADGYTLLFSAAGPLTVTPHTYPHLGYKPVKGFEPIALVATQPLLLVVNPKTGIKSVADLIKDAKAKPGKLNYGSFGNGSAAHLAAESFKMLTHVDMTHVPYKGSAPALNGLLAGQVDLMFDVFSTSAPLVKAGRLHALAVTSKQRSPELPNVPTMDEAGVKNLSAGTWFGLLAPAGTSKEVVDRLNKAVNKALSEKQVRDTLGSQGALVAGGTSAEFAQFFQSEYEKMGTLAKAIGIKVD